MHGAKLLDSTVDVRGVIVWVYDCATAVRMPGETDKQIAKRLGDDPTLCERPKFYLGDTRDTPIEKAVWVVDVPRPYNKLELERITPANRTMADRCEPKSPTCPVYKVGDTVVVRGDFKISSPHSESNSDGLVVYAQMTNVTAKWQTPGSSLVDGGAPDPAIDPPRPPPPPPRPRPLSQPMRRVVAADVKAKSMKALDEGNKQNGMRAFPMATRRYEDAVATWPDNHLAWYGMGGAFAASGEWGKARDAFGKAVVLRPDVGMYHQWLAVAQYEAAVTSAREDQARKANRKVTEVSVDLSAINFTQARSHLDEAIAIDPGLWRSHYYLGRIERAAGQASAAADAFSHAIAANPATEAPYIALTELYRKWDYTEQAIKVATSGVANVSTPVDVWFTLGMAYEDKHLDDKAIEAFTKAVDANSSQALYQRGQIYVRKHDRVHAKADLEAYMKTGTNELSRQLASRMLLDLAAKR